MLITVPTLANSTYIQHKNTQRASFILFLRPTNLSVGTPSVVHRSHLADRRVIVESIAPRRVGVALHGIILYPPSPLIVAIGSQNALHLFPQSQPFKFSAVTHIPTILIT